MFRADLHCHTTCSDGSLTPYELIQKAKGLGLSGLSITDHDTIDAYKDAPNFAKEAGLLLGTGIELSCLFRKNVSIHILGYDFDPNSSELQAFCAQHQQRRLKRNQMILHKLKGLNIQIPEEELLEMGSSIGRPHIAKMMVQKGYVKSIKEAFQFYLGDEKPGFARGDVPSVEESIEIIHKANGKAFLAHPHLIRPTREHEALLLLPFDGIECYYATFPPEKEKKWLRIAEKKNLLISGGSDFHGEAKEGSPLGASWVDEACFYKIFQHSISRD